MFKHKGHYEDLSSSEDSDSAPPRIRTGRNRAKGISIHDGPQAIAKFRVGGTGKLCGSVTQDIQSDKLYLSVTHHECSGCDL